MRRISKMVDPFSLSAIGAVALTEGIKFLYGQAGEALKRWRERKDAAVKNPSALADPVQPVVIALPPLFDGQLSSPQIHFDAVERLEEQIRALRKDLLEYADGTEAVDINDRALLERIDALRTVLEVVYQQRLTFKGEQRPPSGPLVEGSVDVDEVAGYVAAVRVRQITEGNVKGSAKVQRVDAGGQIIGVDIDTIGR
jgi:hypothetical protein